MADTEPRILFELDPKCLQILTAEGSVIEIQNEDTLRAMHRGLTILLGKEKEPVVIPHPPTLPPLTPVQPVITNERKNETAPRPQQRFDQMIPGGE